MKKMKIDLVRFKIDLNWFEIRTKKIDLNRF